MVKAFSSLDSDFNTSKAKDLLGIADATDDIIDSVGNLSGSTGIIDKFKSGITGLTTTAKNFVIANPIATGVMATTAALGAGYIAYKKYKSNMIKEADSATTDWNATYSDLQDKMSQYKELKIKLDSGGLSDAETLSIKQQILDIQSQITSAYGEQASGINMVNGSLENQLSVIQKIESKQASQNLNENRKEYEDAQNEMTKNRSYMLGDVAQSINAGGVAKDIYDIAKDIEGITPDKDETGAYTIRFNGDVTKADEAINSFMTRVGDLREKYKTDKYATDIIDNVLGYSQTSLEDVSDVLGKYQDNYKSFLQQSMFAEGTGKGKPATILNDYAQAVDDYNRALASGNKQEIVSARDNYNSVKDSVDGLLKNKPQYESMFDDVSNQLDESSRKAFDFSEAMQGSVNKDNVFSKSAKDINKLSKSLNKLDLDTSDIVNALTTSGKQTGESAIRKLANIWGLTTDASQEEIEDFAYTLSNMGLVSNGSSDSIKNVASSYDELTTSLQNAITNQEAVNTAVQNSVSATGLTSDDITNLSNIYGEYEGFESIFERSANGVQLNRDALNALEQQQESLIKQDFAESIREQQKAYEDAQKAYKDAKKDSTVSDADRAALKVSMDDAKTQLENIKMLSSVYDGLTSSYNKWMSASSDTEEGARFDNVMSKFQSAQSLREQGLIGTEEFRGAVDYFWSGDASLLNAQELKKTYDELNPLISDWYQLNEDGSANNDASIKAFRDDAKQLSDILGKPVNTSFDELEDGTRKATLNAKEFADAWGVSEDVVQDVAGKMRDYGWDVEVTGITDSSENIKELAKNAEEAQSKLKRLTGETYEWDFNTTDAQKATEQVQKATEQLQQFKKSTGEYDYSQSGATEAAQVYEAVVRQEQVATKPAISNVDASSVVESSQNLVTAAQNFQTAKDELDVQTQLANQGLQNDVENATKTANEALTNLQEVSKNSNPFDIDTSGIQEAENSLAGISEKDLQMKVGADTSDAESSVEGIANEEVEVPVTVQLEEGQFSALMEGITGEEYEATVTVNEEKGTEVTNEQPEAKTQVVNEEKGTDVTSEEPKPKTQIINEELGDTIELGVGDSQQGGVITYQSKVEKPEVPDVKGKTVLYKSKVQKPVVPDVEGKTVIYKAEVEDASVPTLEGTVNYEGKFPKSAPVLNGTVNYSSNSPSEVSAASGTANFTLGSSPKEVPPAQGIANFSLGSSPTTVPSASGVANFSLGRYPTSLPAITQTVIANKVGFASGTMLSPAHADGTAYNVINYKSAYADGKVSLPHDEKALVNEMGTESIIRDGKWMLIPGGMHVQSLKKGDIVLNASQTADLLKYGKASGHGKAYAQGTVGKGKVVANAYASGTKSKWERAVDWIERLLTKLELTAELAGLKSENRTSVKNKNSYIDKQYKTTSSLITANQKAVKAYQKAAGRVGLAGDLKKKVLTGNYNIQDYSEANQQKIKDYQEMIDKARECTKAVEELKKQQKELEQTKLDNVVNYYDSINSKLEAQQSIYSAQQKFYQESGRGGNEQERKMIDEQLKLQKLITKNLDKEASNYAKQMKSAKKKFGENSNEYRDAQAKYYEIKSAKVESQTSEENLKNQRREISYSLKQYIIDGFERVASRLSANEKYYTANDASVNTRIGNYDKQIDNYNDQINAKRELQKLYIQRMAQLHVNDAEYQETADKVAKLDEEIINLAMDIEEAKDSIRKARWEAFNDNMTSLNNRITENDEIRKMLNQNGMVNREDGTLNADGYANILLIAKGMELNNQKIADYKVALSKVKEELDNGVISQSEYNEYVNQYQSEIRKAASANKDYSDSLISMYKTQIRVDAVGYDTNIILGFRNLQNSLEVSCDTELYTSFEVRGNEDMTINYVNFDTSQIEDISYFLNTKYMSQELIDKYNAWIEYRESRRPEYIELSGEYNTLLNTISEITDRVPADGVENDWTTYEEDDLKLALDNYNAMVTQLEHLYVDDHGNFDLEALKASTDWELYKQMVDYIIPSIKAALQKQGVDTSTNGVGNMFTNVNPIITIGWQTTTEDILTPIDITDKPCNGVTRGIQIQSNGGFYQEVNGLIVGDTYTISVYVKCESNGIINIGNSTSSQDDIDIIGSFDVTNEWVRVNVSFVALEKYYQCYFTFGEGNYVVCGMQLERGTLHDFGYFAGLGNETDILSAWETDWNLYGTIELKNKLDSYKNVVEALKENGFDSPYLEGGDYSWEYHTKMYQKYMDYYSLIDDCQKAYDERCAELKVQEDKRDEITEQRQQIVKSVQKENFGSVQETYDGFADEELSILRTFINQTDYVNENITLTTLDTEKEKVNQQYELYLKAKEQQMMMELLPKVVK